MLHISIGFYNIEHTYIDNGKILITKEVVLRRNLNDNIESFNNILDFILLKDSNTHYYYLTDIMEDVDINTLQNDCNVEWIYIDDDRNDIIFYQTDKQREKNDIILSYKCNINSKGERVWDITDSYPDANNKKTLSVKLYNFLFNNILFQDI